MSWRDVIAKRTMSGIVAMAEQNLQVHLELRKNVRARFTGGRAGEGDTQQAEERVAARGQGGEVAAEGQSHNSCEESSPDDNCARCDN